MSTKIIVILIVIVIILLVIYILVKNKNINLLPSKFAALNIPTASTNSLVYTDTNGNIRPSPFVLDSTSSSLIVPSPGTISVGAVTDVAGALAPITTGVTSSTNGQVLTSNGSGVQWSTPSSSNSSNAIINGGNKTSGSVLIIGATDSGSGIEFVNGGSSSSNIVVSMSSVGDITAKGIISTITTIEAPSVITNKITFSNTIPLPTNTNTVSVTGPANSNIPASYTLTLPSTPGTSGQHLQTDGTGILSWVNVSSTPSVIFSSSFITQSVTGSTLLTLNTSNVVMNIGTGTITNTNSSNYINLPKMGYYTISYNVNILAPQTLNNNIFTPVSCILNAVNPSSMTSNSAVLNSAIELVVYTTTTAINFSKTFDLYIGVSGMNISCPYIMTFPSDVWTIMGSNSYWSIKSLF